MKNDTEHRGLITELGRRGVYQAVGIYVAVAWGVIEILITVADRFGWPTWLGDAALILFLTGLPFVVLLAWAFDLTGSGLRKVAPGSLRGKALIAGGATVALAISASFLVLRGQEDVRPTAVTPTPEGTPVIAVLPFENRTGAEENDYVALSFTDEIINRINAHPDLIAVDSHSVRDPRFENFLARAGDRIDYLVRGSLLAAPVGTELQVRLLDRNSIVTWEHEAVRTMDNPVAMRAAQQFVAGEVAKGIGYSLTGIDYCGPSDNAQANALYLEAKEQYNARGAANVAGAARKLERAIELDPDYARALDLLSSVYQRFPTHVSADPDAYGMTAEELQAFLRTQPSLPLARRALDRCPNLAESYYWLEISEPVHHNYADSVDIMRESLRREPGATELLGRMARHYVGHGHIATARKVLEEWRLRDPLHPRGAQLMGWVATMEGEHEHALDYLDEAVDLGFDASFGTTELRRAWNLVALDDLDGLNDLLGEDFTATEGFAFPGWPLDPRDFILARQDPGARAILRDRLSHLIDIAKPWELSFLVGGGGAPPWAFELGDRDLAWRALQRFAAEGAPGAQPEGIWYHRWRHWFGTNELLDLDLWTRDYVDFWNRFGPPDGCSWDGERLDCTWAEPPA